MHSTVQPLCLISRRWVPLDCKSVLRLSQLCSHWTPWLSAFGVGRPLVSTHHEAVAAKRERGQRREAIGFSASAYCTGKSPVLPERDKRQLQSSLCQGTGEQKHHCDQRRQLNTWATLVLCSKDKTPAVAKQESRLLYSSVPATLHRYTGNQPVLFIDKRRHGHRDTSFCHEFTHRTFHSCTGLQVSELNNRGKTRSKKRIPLSCKEEIDEVIEEAREVIQEFASVLGCREGMVEDMVRGDTRLVTQFTKASVIAKMKLLMEHGFTAEEITSRYQIFSRSYQLMQARLKTMEPVKHYRYGLVMLLLSDTHFQSRMDAYHKEVAIMGNHSSQASFIADLLGCTEEEIVSIAKRRNYEFLLTLPPSRLQEVVHLLRSVGVSIEEMREKPLMLKCPLDLAQERLDRVREAGVFELQLVPYILTNSDSNFENSFTSWVRNAAAMGGYTDTQELLMDRLQCSERDVQALMNRAPNIAVLTFFKLKSCLDILQEEMGLSCSMILSRGELLYLSPKRLLSRWVILKPLELTESVLVRELLLPERKYIAKYGHGSDL